MQEVWRPVVGWEGLYEVSDLGRVKCLPRKWVPTARLLRIVHSPGKYPQVGLCSPKRNLTRMVHQLVAEAFLGPCPQTMEVCHNDGDRANNRLENLRYDTRKANHADKRVHGTLRIGDNCPVSKLTAEQVLAIRASDLPPAQLAAQYAVTPSNITAIIRRKSWRHI
jgi:hypothetical protein